MSAFTGGAFGGGELDLSELENVSRVSKYIGYGEVDVLYPDEYYLTDDIGSPILDDDGNQILDDDGNPILDATGDFILDESGTRILQDFESPYLLDAEGDILLDDDDRPILPENWRTKIIAGVKTPLDTLETEVQYVTIQAKFTNLGKIWVGGFDVAKNRGVYLAVESAPLTLHIDDLRKIYIIGNAGEGVTFLYGTREDLFLTSPDGSFITSPDGSPINV